MRGGGWPATAGRWRLTLDRLGSVLRSDGGLLLLILLVQLVLISPSLMPTYSGINAYDEAKYIESGRLLLKGEIRNLAWGPIVALVYAPFHLLWSSSLDWFTLEARAGQFVLFISMWLATVYLAKRLIGWQLALISAGVLFVSTAYFGVLDNPSDATLVVFSALTLAKLMAFANAPNTGDAWQASLLVGLAVLARVEAVLYLPLLVVLGWWLGRNRLPAGRTLVLTAVPAVAVVAVYLVLSAATSGLELGVSGKAYDSFEVNQPIAGGASNEEQRQRAIELFGTQQENQGSILRAIGRNPLAFLSRPWVNGLEEPGRYLDAFGARLGPALMLLAVWGLFRLAKSESRRLVPAVLLWALPPAVSLFFLPLHFARQISFVLLVLAAAGVEWVVRPDSAGRRSLLIASGLMAAAGLGSGKLGIAVSGLVLGTALAFIELAYARLNHNPWSSGGALALLLAAGIILRPSYRFPDYPPLGDSAREQAVHELQRSLPAGTRILEPLPLPAVAARLVEVSPGQVPADIQSPESLQAWLQAQGIRAIYVEGTAGYPLPVYELVKAGVGTYWAEAYRSGNLAVYLLP